MKTRSHDNILSDLLASREWLLADGATGTELFKMGLNPGTAPELWNTDQPDKIARLYQNAIDAGCDIFLTNSFGGTSARLKLCDAADRVFELNHAAARIARQVADAAGRPVVVAGAMGPTGEILQPIGRLSYDDAFGMFLEQAQGLKAGGVDLVWIETMSSFEEYTAAADAAVQAGLPWVGTMSFDSAGRTMMGITPTQLAHKVESMVNPPLAYGANCGVGAAEMVRSVLDFAAQGLDRLIIAKASAGLPREVDGQLRYLLTPAMMAEYACLARDAGARIIGGCCGTTPAHLKAMKNALETRPRGPRPTLEQVVAALGPFSPEEED
jgi:5-methyltetrahydrofolate--homocysteine methyltransferase